MIYRRVIFLCLALGFCSVYSVPQQNTTFTIMLNPAGTKQSTERLIDNTFERSIAAQAAQTLKQKLVELFPHVSVILTRTPGQATASTHNAHFANSLNVNLFVSLHFYQETDTKPHVYLYTYSYNNALTLQPSDFTFYRQDQSYIFNKRSSMQVADSIQATWAQKPHAHQFTTHKVIGFPCAPLIGVISPAIAIDMGIKKNTDWHLYIQPLIDAISAIIKAAQ